MNSVLKVTGALADATRYSIYEYILKEHRDLTVQDIAAQFGIHPNVARLHLTKLEDVNLIGSCLQKTGKGGRPGKLYKPAERAVQLAFPHRDYQLLSDILLEALELFGEDGVKMAEAAAQKAGRRSVEAEMKGTVSSPPNKERLQLLKTLTARIGYTAHAEETEKGLVVQFAIYNCPFKELLQEKAAATCRIHKAFLQGVMDTLFGPAVLSQHSTMLNGCKECIYQSVAVN
ncbi:helix-turn-helix domain-containing protein [Domibacillus indicus]|uniref:helix-turn-helix transcriptional regulator n=1 Tax=Domibacillus indicus TaxID=1437523 RepID=UPI00203ACB06|nr:helix-turn-helix domain-containing protein [Domibacillus indicus]MCM3788419.1 helix-turn-helix domain-containing protein [Domibacillus indicus]